MSNSICRINKITKQELLFEDNKHVLKIAELETKIIILEAKLKAITEKYNELFEKYLILPKIRHFPPKDRLKVYNPPRKHGQTYPIVNPPTS